MATPLPIVRTESRRAPAAVASPKIPLRAPSDRALPKGAGPFSQLLVLENPDEIAKLAKKYADVHDIKKPNDEGWTLLHEAANAHRIALCIELLKLKVRVSFIIWLLRV